MSKVTKQQKVLMISGISQTIVNFRMGLIRAFQAKGSSVSVIAFDDVYKDDITANGVEFFCVNDNNRSLNPFGMRKLQKQYLSIIRQVQPDIVLTFILKPNIFGTRAAKKAGVKKIFSMVEGVGDVFINNSLKWKLIRTVVCKMYRKSFRYAKKVFFLNNDDKDEFVDRKLVKKEQCEIVPGVGVDIEHFAYKPIKNYRTFLMIARMLKTKGVMEYCQTARIVKQKYPDAVFNYLGAEGTVKIVDIKGYTDDGSINYLGTTKDVRPYLEDCTAFVLPSYREGFGLVNAEAEAVGRAVITCDVIGTRDTVADGYNGFLAKVRDSDALSEKMIWCIEHPQEVEQMGINGRKLAQEKFDTNKISNRIVEIVES